MRNSMNQILFLVIGLLCSLKIYADCSVSALSVFPKEQTIKQNSIFMIEGYANSQQIILELNKKYTIYLKSGQKKIKLLVTETYVGQFLITQAILKPEKALDAGIEYTMYIDNLPKDETLNKYNTTTQKYEPVTYKVLAEKDTEKPLLTSKPKECKKSLIQYGCGPSIHVIFTNPAKDNSDLLVKTTVRNVKTNKTTTYYIEANGNQIEVGHNMCSGAFDFDEGNTYEVEFSFMDASGNLTAWTGERIKFTKPTKEN
jgi:hypothetical protein